MKRSQRQDCDSLLDLNITLMRGVGVFSMNDDDCKNYERENYSTSSDTENQDSQNLDVNTNLELLQESQSQSIKPDTGESELDLSSILEKELVLMKKKRLKRFRTFLQDSLLQSNYEQRFQWNTTQNLECDRNRKMQINLKRCSENIQNTNLNAYDDDSSVTKNTVQMEAQASGATAPPTHAPQQAPRQ